LGKKKKRICKGTREPKKNKVGTGLIVPGKKERKFEPRERKRQTPATRRRGPKRKGKGKTGSQKELRKLGQARQLSKQKDETPLVGTFTKSTQRATKKNGRREE